MDSNTADVLKTLIQNQSDNLKGVTKDIAEIIKDATKRAPFWLSVAVAAVVVIWIVHPATANTLLLNILNLLKAGGNVAQGLAKRTVKGTVKAGKKTGKALITAASATSDFITPRLQLAMDQIQMRLEIFFHPRRRLHWRLNIYLYILATVAFLAIGVKFHGNGFANAIFAFGAIMFLGPSLLLALVLNQLRPKEAR